MLKSNAIKIVGCLLSLLVASTTYAICPDISTAIKQINGISNLSTGVLQDNFTSYTGTSSFDKSTITYYTITAPTAVGPVRQLKLLEAALATGVQLPPASANDTSVSCVYLGSMTGTSSAPVPVVDNGWQQIVLIKSTGSGPMPPPPPPPPPSGPKINVNVTFSFPTGVTPPATVSFVTLTDIVGNSYTTKNASTAGAVIKDVPTSTTGTAEYVASADNATVDSTTYCAEAATENIPAKATSFSFQFTYSREACSIGPTPTPGATLPGWPKYLAMGDITQGINQFTLTDKSTGAQRYLDADYLYASPNGDGSIGILLGLPDIKDSLGKNWFKVFYLLHHSPSSLPPAPPNVIAVPVYYTTAAGSGGLESVFVNNPTKPNLAPYFEAPDMSPGNLTGQYVNLINFLALIRNESIRQPGLTVSILYNPDLLGKMFQEGLTHPSTNYWLDYKFNDIKSSLENAVNAVTFPDGTPILIDADAQKILKDNLSKIENAIDAKGEENGRAYLNSISILTKTLLSAPNCLTCQNISYGWHLNAWLAGGNANNLRSPGSGVRYGQSAATWLLGTGLFTGSYAANFIAFDKYEADGLTASALSNGYFWNWQTFNEYISFVSTIAHGLSPNPAKPIPVMLWQIPASHLPNVGETNTFPSAVASYPQMTARMDNNTNYIFGDSYLDPQYQLKLGLSRLVTNTSIAQIGDYTRTTPSNYYCGGVATPPCKSVTIAQAAGIVVPSDIMNFTEGHLTNLAKAGVMAVLWGGGDYNRTTGGFCPFSTPCSAPTADNVPNAFNDDNGWLAHVMSNYYLKPQIIASAATLEDKH